MGYDYCMRVFFWRGAVLLLSDMQHANRTARHRLSTIVFLFLPSPNRIRRRFGTSTPLAVLDMHTQPTKTSRPADRTDAACARLNTPLGDRRALHTGSDRN